MSLCRCLVTPNYADRQGTKSVQSSNRRLSRCLIVMSVEEREKLSYIYTGLTTKNETNKDDLNLIRYDDPMVKLSFLP